MKRLFLSFLVFSSLPLSAPHALAQTRSWASPTTGAWTTPSRWSPADVPDTPTESATFDLFGAYAANLGVASLSIEDLRIARGDVTLRTTGVANATLQIGGDFTVGGTVTLADIAGTTVRPQVAGRLEVLAGGSLTAEGGALTAAVSDIAGGTTVATTLVEVTGASASLGSLTLAAAGAAGSRGELLATAGSTVSVAALSVATDSPHAIADLSLVASSLTQSSGSMATIGRTLQAGAAGRATLAASDAGHITLAHAAVLPTGKLLSVGGSTVTITGSLDINGGLYEERDAALRDFSTLSSLTVRGGGVARLVNQHLTITTSQTLALAGGEFESAEPLLLTAGGKVEASGAALNLLDAPVTITPTGVIEALAGASLRFDDPVDHQGGAFSAAALSTLTLSSSYRGPGISGSGTVAFADAVRPAQGIGAAAFGGAVSLSPTSTLHIELAGPTNHDRLTAAGAVTLDGALTVELLDGGGLFEPAAGQLYRLVDGASLIGSFDALTLPTLAPGLAWRVERTPTSFALRVASPGLTGDFNSDGLIDAADYSIYRDTAGSTGQLLAADANGDLVVDSADLSAWRSAYGATSPSVAAPEPAGALRITLLLVALVARPAARP